MSINKYPARCRCCRVPVAAGAGFYNGSVYCSELIAVNHDERFHAIYDLCIRRFNYTASTDFATPAEAVEAQQPYNTRNYR